MSTDTGAQALARSFKQENMDSLELSGAQGQVVGSTGLVPDVPRLESSPSTFRYMILKSLYL